MSRHDEAMERAAEAAYYQYWAVTASTCGKWRNLEESSRVHWRGVARAAIAAAWEGPNPEKLVEAAREAAASVADVVADEAEAEIRDSGITHIEASTLPSVCREIAQNIRAGMHAISPPASGGRDGWVRVPREPTDEMVSAAGGALKQYIESLSVESRSKLRPRKIRSGDTAGYKIAPRVKARVRWQAMIDAAPALTKQDAAVAGEEQDNPSSGCTPSPSDAAGAGEVERLREALRKIALTPAMPFPDPGAHSWRAWGSAVHLAWCQIQQIARTTLTPGKGER